MDLALSRRFGLLACRGAARPEAFKAGIVAMVKAARS